MRLNELASAFGGGGGKGPLQGLRVLDAGTMIAGPLAATHLADFGAR
jgi:crotonobetainyl-CoA:carnitine CoA-transferase CaiB-like acyl-CoA transferase